MTTSKEWKQKMWFPANLQLLIEERFGSKKGLIKYFGFLLLYRLGAYRTNAARQLGYKPKRLVFACAGNICRSPLAEYVAKDLGVSTCSFGLDTRGDDPADARAIELGKRYGLNLQDHNTQPVSRYIPESGDLLVVMEPKHLRLLSLQGIKTPAILLGLTDHAEPKPYIHDPYNTKITFFNKIEEEVIALTRQLVNHVQP